MLEQYTTTVNSIIIYQCQQSGFTPSVPSSVCGEDERWSPDPTQVVCVMLPGTSIYYRLILNVISCGHQQPIVEPKQYLLYASETLLVRHYIRMLLKCFVYSTVVWVTSYIYLPSSAWSYRFVLRYTQHQGLNDH